LRIVEVVMCRGILRGTSGDVVYDKGTGEILEGAVCGAIRILSLDMDKLYERFMGNIPDLVELEDVGYMYVYHPMKPGAEVLEHVPKTRPWELSEEEIEEIDSVLNEFHEGMCKVKALSVCTELRWLLLDKMPAIPRQEDCLGVVSRSIQHKYGLSVNTVRGEYVGNNILVCGKKCEEIPCEFVVPYKINVFRETVMRLQEETDPEHFRRY
jgi:hypothetical protein